MVRRCTYTFLFPGGLRGGFKVGCRLQARHLQVRSDGRRAEVRPQDAYRLFERLGIRASHHRL